MAKLIFYIYSTDSFFIKSCMDWPFGTLPWVLRSLPLNSIYTGSTSRFGSPSKLLLLMNFIWHVVQGPYAIFSMDVAV